MKWSVRVFDFPLSLDKLGASGSIFSRLLILLLIMAGASPVLARDRNVVTSADALLRGTVGSRPAGMGGAFTAMASGPTAVRYNPASLSDETIDGDRRYRAFVHYDDSFNDRHRGDVAVLMPGLSGGMGVSFSYLDYGSVTRATVGNKSTGAPRDRDSLLRFAYGRSVRERLSLGISAAVYNLQVADDDASGTTIDLAARYRSPSESVTIGVALRNIGPSFQVNQVEEQLPLSLAVGAAYRPEPRFLVTADVEWVRDLDAAFRGGAEFWITKPIALRMGYDGRSEVGSKITAGAGFRYYDVEVDYAVVPFSDLNRQHRVSAAWSFGHPEPRFIEPTAPNVDRDSKTAPARSSRPTAAAIRSPVTRRRMEAMMPPSAGQERPPLVEVRMDGRLLENEVVVTALAPPRKPIRTIDQVLDEARAAHGLEDPELERELYREGLRLDPRNYSALYNLAAIHFRAREFHQSRALFEAATATDPVDAEAWLFLGMSESAIGNVSASRDAFRRVLELDPSNHYARVTLTRD